jgi:hypothetical protein
MRWALPSTCVWSANFTQYPTQSVFGGAIAEFKILTHAKSAPRPIRDRPPSSESEYRGFTPPGERRHPVIRERQVG